MSQLVEEKDAPKKVKRSVRKKKPVSKRGWASLVNGDFFSRDNLIKNLPFMFYVTFLVVCYIGYGYYVDKTSGHIVELEERSRELKADLNNESSYYNQVSMYSHIEDSTVVNGIGPSVEPPVKIKVLSSEFLVE